jgi:hypothetical protein
MANDEQETLFDAFQAVSSPQYENSAALESEISVTSTLDQLMSEASQLTAGGGQPTSPVAGGGQAADADSDARLETLVSNLRSDQKQPSTASVNAGIDALASSLHTTADVQQSVGGGGAEGSGTSSSAGGTDEPNVINMSAEAGSRLNSEPTTEAIYPNTSSGGGSGGGSSPLSLISSFLGGGLGMIPLVGGLLSLFGGGSSEPQPLEKYVQPDQLYFTGADVGGSVQDADYNQYGMPRLYSDATSGSISQSGSSSAGGTTSGGGGSTSPINVTIQALDSQSFLDRSNDIAQAVRQAMLTSNSINDVVNDL